MYGLQINKQLKNRHDWGITVKFVFPGLYFFINSLCEGLNFPFIDWVSFLVWKTIK